MKLWITAIALALSLSAQGALKVMCIGDSMTREYDVMAIYDGQDGTFPSPDSDPGNANTMNWVEILAERRATYLDFGDYDPDLFSYPDWRIAGHKYNFGIPGADTNRWMGVIDPDISDWENFLVDLATRNVMRDQYPDMDVIVIMLGGNDLRANYGNLYDALPGDATAQAFIANIIANLGDLIDEIREHDRDEDTDPHVPLVLANVPDLGATPDKIDAHEDPVKRANVSAIIADLNAAVATLVTTRGTPEAPIVLAPINNLTDRILSSDPFCIGALEMVKDKDPENPPLYLFCKGGLHPSSNGQSVIANILLEAINTATSSNIDLLPDREVITHVLGLNPDKPFIDWATAAGLSDLSMTADIDGDGIPSLGEYLLDLNPLFINHNHVASVQDISGVPTLALSYTPNITAGKLADINIKQSIDLNQWADVPAANLIDLGNGSYQARMPLGSGLGFFRMEFQLKP